MSFEVPNPIERVDPGLARRFEAAIADALGDAHPHAVSVRFGVWDGEDDGPCFVCKIESAPRAAPGAPPAWRWWSPLVRTPEELAGHVRAGLRALDRPAEAARPRDEYWGWAATGSDGA